MEEDIVSIYVPGEPRGKGRPRFSSAGGFVRSYTDAKTRNYEAFVKLCAKEAMENRPPFASDAPLCVRLIATFPIPQSWSKRRATAAIGAPVTKKPDIDNIVKTIDALIGIVFPDDKQVASVHAWKIYGEFPSLEIEVYEKKC